MHASCKLVFNTDVRLRLVFQHVEDPEWISSLFVGRELQLQNATNQNIGFVGTMLYLVRIGETCVRALFGIVRNEVAFILPRTTFIDRSVKEILPTERKIVPYYSQTLPIVTVVKVASDNNIATRVTDMIDSSVKALKTEVKGYVVHVVMSKALQTMFEALSKL